MTSIQRTLTSLLVVAPLVFVSRGASASEPSDEQHEEFVAKEHKLVIGTAAAGATSGVLLIIGTALHFAAGNAAGQCATNITQSIGSASTSNCDEELDQLRNRIVGRNVALVGFGIGAVATIVTGALLGVHRSNRPQRVAFTGSGLRLRF